MKIKVTNHFGNGDSLSKNSAQIDIDGNCVIANYNLATYKPNKSGDLTVTVDGNSVEIKKGQSVFGDGNTVDFNQNKYSVFMQIVGDDKKLSLDDLIDLSLKSEKELNKIGIGHVDFKEDSGVAIITMTNNEILMIDFETEQEQKATKTNGEKISISGISDYTKETLQNDNVAILASQKHLINLIKYFEGDSYHYYEGKSNPYKDKYGTVTSGYGEKIDKVRTEDECFESMLNTLSSRLEEVKSWLKKQNVEISSLPVSIVESLADLCYNKGLGAVSGNAQLLEALKTKNWSVVVANLSYVTSKKTGAFNKPDPGLYKRSFARMILACRDLKGRELNEAKEEIKKFYNTAKQIEGADKQGLDKIYEAFIKGNISTPPIERASTKYTVKHKDTLYNIANNHCPKDMTINDYIAQIKKYNSSINFDSLQVGAILNIPVQDNQSQKEAESDVSQKTQPLPQAVGKYVISNETEDYVVEDKYKGKGAFAIARDISAKYLTPGFTVAELSNEIQRLNPSGISVGVTIKLPKITSQNANGTVVNKPSVPVPENNTQDVEEEDNSSNVMTVQKMQKIMGKPVEKQWQDKSGIKILEFPYMVQQGDTLFSLGLRYNIRYEELKEYNSLTQLKFDKEIKIPKVVYTIKKKETLKSICERYGIDEQTVLELNDIDNRNMIKAGEQLELPAYIHVVHSGESLSQLSEKTGVDIKIIKSVNNLKNDTIKPGDRLLLMYKDIDKVSDHKVETRTSESGIKEEIVEKEVGVGNRPYLKKRKINGKVVATREVFKPTNKNGPLRGKTVIVNAGHGYKNNSALDPGAPGAGNFNDEWLQTYDNAMRLKGKLIAQGATVIYLQGYRDLVSAELAKKENKADAFISIHLNSSSNPDTEDKMLICYQKGATKGMHLARKCEESIDSMFKDKSYARTEEHNYQVLRDSRDKQHIPGVLWEIAFMNTKSGKQKLSDSKLMDEYAELLCMAVINYFETEGKIKYYTVKSGDTLSTIASKHNIELATLLKNNGLKSNSVISVGQSLIISQI